MIRSSRAGQPAPSRLTAALNSSRANARTVEVPSTPNRAPAVTKPPAERKSTPASSSTSPAELASALQQFVHVALQAKLKVARDSWICSWHKWLITHKIVVFDVFIRCILICVLTFCFLLPFLVVHLFVYLFVSTFSIPFFFFVYLE